MYSSVNFKTKKAFKKAVTDGEQITVFSPAGIGWPPDNGKCCVEGPWSPQPHKWYADVIIKDKIVVKVE